MSRRVTATEDGFVYDGFISYSQAVSGDLATTLQRWLERFATPWYRPRRLRVFRDYTSLSASHDLTDSIQRALAGTRWFILLASPRAAQSKWVEREVAWWRKNRPPERVCIVLTGGDLVWDDESGDWGDGTDALPPSARGMFTAQPLWVDLRAVTSAKELDRSNVDLLNKVAQIAAPLRGVDKDAIVGEHITLHRRARLQRRGGVVSLVLLLVTALIAAYIAVGNAQEAQAQSRIAQARALASAAVANVDTNLDIAQLLAVEAYRMDPRAETRSALLQAVTSSPHLVRYLPAGSEVQRVAGSDNRQFLVAGTKNGRVLRWDTKAYTQQVIAQLKRPVTGLAVSATGATIVATDGSTAVLWTGKGPAETISVPPGGKPSLVGVSPSGRSVVVHRDDGVVTLFDRGIRQLAQTQTQTRAENEFGKWDELAVPSDRQIVLFEAEGVWERRVLPTLKRSGGGTVGFPNRNFASAISPGGQSFTYSNGATWLPLWETREPTPDSDSPPLQAASRGTRPTALAISRDGKRAATASNGSITVSDVTPASAQLATPTEVRASGTVNPEALAFVGDTNHLVSASGSRVAFWDLTQLSRIAKKADVRLASPCNACTAPWLVASPDNETVAMVGDGGGWVTVHSFSSSHWSPGGELSASGLPVFTGDGKNLIIPTSLNESWEIRGVSSGLPLKGHLPASNLVDSVKAASLSRDKQRIVAVTVTDRVIVRDTGTGRIVKEIPGPESSGDPFEQPNTSVAAVDATASHAALVTEKGVRLVDIVKGTAQEIPSAETLSVAFAGTYLAVGHYDGSIQMWSMRSRRFEKPVGDDREADGAFAISTDGSLLAQRLQDDSVALTDIENDKALGTLTLLARDPAAESSLIFADDGTVLFVALERTEQKGELQRWSLTPDVWTDAACATSGRDLTRAEWGKYVGTTPPSNLHCRR
ncbi:toll/interleukin-1 receptor domain-containing protein [Streptomyces sp. NPDC002730]|uniref:toll/interleukin-1 receptor domain-containing protein n=1 Tax=Streptomyces sp. NPDC002730 TaxID=3364662 RepID=UPI0036B956C3